jgi:hypothetical protein
MHLQLHQIFLNVIKALVDLAPCLLIVGTVSRGARLVRGEQGDERILHIVDGKFEDVCILTNKAKVQYLKLLRQMFVCFGNRSTSTKLQNLEALSLYKGD